MNTILKRIVALVLCLVMTAGYIPVNAFADETGETVAAAAAEATTEPSVVETAEETAADTTEETEPEKPGKPEKSGKHEKHENNGKGKKSGQETTPVTETTVPVTEETVPVTSEATEPTVIAVTGITLDQTALEVGVGELPMSLTATVQPEDATDKTVTWTSSEPGVAFVDENGTLTFGYMGEATITATAGEFSATCVVTVGEGEWNTYEGGTVVIAGSDYQRSDSSTIMTNIMNQIKEDYGTPYGILMGGDYDAGDVNTNAQHIKNVDNTISGVFPTLSAENRIYIQGNHENYAGLKVDGTNLMDTSGKQDTDHYGVYVINHDDFPWTTSTNPKPSESLVKATAAALGVYLDGKVAEDYDKPIFVTSHLPLHATTRGDNRYAKLIFDKLEAAGEAGLNIIFLAGHNHSGGYDQYLGNGSFYLPVGSSLTVVDGKSSPYTDDSISFTYMNYGYLGKISGSACTHQTMTVFEITDSQVTVKRYAADGLHKLKAAGVAVSGYNTDSNEIGTEGAVIELGEPEEKVEQTDNNVTVSAPGLTGLTVVKKDVTHDQETYSAYASYDITLQGYEQGKTATVTITLDEADGFDASRKVIVIDVEKNTETEKSIEGGKVTFTTNHFSTYNIAQKAVPVSSGNTYELVTSIEPGEKYVIVGNDDDVALMDDNGSFGSQTVTISGTTLTSDVALTEWTISATSGGTIVSDAGNQLGYDNSAWGLVTGGTVAFDITANSGNFKVQMQRGYNNYNFYYDGTDWTDKSTSNHYVRLYKANGTGSGGGSTVTPEGGDWVTITSGVGGTIYTLDTDGLNAGEEYLIVDTKTVGNGNAMTNNSGTAANTVVTITTDSEGNIIAKVEDPANVTWTTSGSSSSANFANGSYNIYLSYNNGVLHTSTRSLKVTHEGNGEYTLKRDSSSSGYYVQYDSSDGWDTLSTTENSVYLYRKTGTESAGDAEYAKLDGELTYTLERGLKDDAALAVVMNGIDVVVSGDKTNENTLTDDNTDIKWELASNYDGNTPGEYAVKIYYKEKLLGTAKVVVPEVTINGISVNPASGVVTVGASEAALVGATVTVDVADGEGEDFTVPVTVSMLKGDFDTSIAGTYPGLTVSYNGFTFTGFTLTVKEKVVNNYPSYPNEGAVKVDKKAHGVDFQKTGVAQVELTTSGVPMNQGVDVVIMLDTSSSMTRDITVGGKTVKRIDLLRPAVNELIEQLQTKRPDGSNPDIDIVIASFNGNTINTDSNYISDGSSKPQISGTGTDDCGVLTGQKTVKSGWVDIMSLSTEWGSSSSNLPTGSGTNYDYGLELVYELLEQKQKDNGESTRKQFVLFMSDGAPSQYNGVWANDGVAEFAEWLLGNYDETDNSTSNNIPNTVSDTHKTFYTGYRAGKGQLHRAAEAIKGAPSDTFAYVTYDANGNGSLKTVKGLGATVYSIGLLLQDVSSNNGSSSPRTAEDQQTVLNTIASSEDLAISITTVDGLGETFTRFGNDVLYAAENAVFEDQMGSKFNIQLASTTKRKVDGEVFTLNPAPTIEVREYTIWTRSELENANGTLSEENAKKVGTRKTDASGNYIYNTLEVVRFNADGTKAYSNKINIDNDNIVGWTTSTDDKITFDEEDNILNAGIIRAKTFWYNNGTTTVKVDVDGNGTAETDLAPETFIWKVGTIKTTELALSYYVYLDDSLEGDASAGSYETNKYAILTYDNYLGNPCQKETISPQLAWLSANVSYAYYLVNRNGVPVNANGEEVTFANREVIVHPTKYGEIKLNSIEDVENLKVASTGVLDEGNYALFDYDAEYLLSVNSDATGGWTIKVGNGKPATTYVTGFSSTQPFTNATSSDSDTDNYDYTHTTVWFAVVWEPDALDDTVVVDYGLPVDVHVLTNDFFGDFGELIGVAKGAVTDSDGNIRTNEILASTDPVAGNYGSALVRKPETGANESNSVIRYELNSMEMKEPEVFTYSVEYTNTKLQTNNGFYYGTLTVIPATTIYYEDTFLDLDSYSKNTDGDWDKDENTELYGNDGKWAPVGTAADATQDEDRPGDINFAFDTLIDANNVYGNDSAYETMSTYSLGSAAKVTVDNDSYATATFTFCGTGFDVISLTSNTTGTITVKVKNAETGANVKNLIVDTYYGLDPNGNVVEHGEENALYQVPVMKYGNMPYGKYEVLITAAYNDFFNHNDAADSYDLYIDAIRIYDPTGNQNEDANNAYVADGEGWPVYEELRNNIIAAADFTVENGAANAELPGLVFIDSDAETASVADYISYGPNNELYLAKEQAIVFNLNLEDKAVAKVQLGMKSATGDEVSYVIADGSQITKAEDLTGASKTVLKTATDMYYDITGMKDKTIVIYNAGESGILSLTNIKVTFDEAPVESQTLFYVNTKQIEKVLKNINTVEPDDTVSDDVVTETTPGTDSTTGEIPGMTIAVPETVTVGTEFEVRVETTSEVTSVTINDVKANTTDSLTWTATLTAADTKTMEVEAVASYTVTQMDEETETEVETTKTVSVSANVKVAPSVTVTLPEFQKIGSKYVVSVKTRNADEVTVNGNAATFKGDVWSYEVTAGGTAGEEAVKVIAKNAVATTTVETSVTLYSAQIEVDKVTVKANEAIAVKITTSSNVEKVTVNGKVIVSYTLSEGSRIWRTETSFKDTGNQKLTVNVYDAEGHEDTAESRDIMVSKATEGEQVQETVKKIIGSIVAQLKKWFNW